METAVLFILNPVIFARVASSQCLDLIPDFKNIVINKMRFFFVGKYQDENEGKFPFFFACSKQKLDIVQRLCSSIGNGLCADF